MKLERIFENPVVLVIEVEPILRMETVQMVKDAGYAVLDAPSTNDAMTILKGRHDIRTVFSEIRVLEHLNGMKLARAIAQRWPLVRPIMTSGVPRADNSSAEWRYIPKPDDGHNSPPRYVCSSSRI